MNPNESITITVMRHFRASAERVFDAFLDPAKAGRFLFATETGRMSRVEIDARVGGRWIIVENRNGEDVEHSGEYLTLDRPTRIVFTVCVPKYAPDVDTISIDITPKDEGCVLVLRHQTLAKYADWSDGVYEGWVGIVNGLAALFEEKTLVLEKSIDINATAARVWDMITNAARNSEWISLWWPGTRLESDWKASDSTTAWIMEDGAIGAKGFIYILDAPHELKISFRVQGLDFPKTDFLHFTLKENTGVTRLTVRMGDFADNPDHEACYPGAKEAWTLSLPKIKAMAEQR